MPIVGGSHEWTIAVAYALFMAASGFVLVPDQTHVEPVAIVNERRLFRGDERHTAACRRDCACHWRFTALFPIAVVTVLLGTVFIMLIRKVK